MQLDWTTFALEIVNFLVLVWLLARFLYRPVASAIAERRAAIEQAMKEAADARGKAAALEAQVHGRLAEWEREKSRLRGELDKALEAERAKRLGALQGELERERSRSEALAQREAAERARDLERRALAQAAAFGARLLRPLAGPELEARIVELALSEAGHLPAERGQALKSARAAQVASAYPLAEAQRRRITDALQILSEHPLSCSFKEDKALLAGLRIEIGPWVFAANLRDELAAFAESGRGGD